MTPPPGDKNPSISLKPFGCECGDILVPASVPAPGFRVDRVSQSSSQQTSPDATTQLTRARRLLHRYPAPSFPAGQRAPATPPPQPSPRRADQTRRGDRRGDKEKTNDRRAGEAMLAVPGLGAAEDRKGPTRRAPRRAYRAIEALTQHLLPSRAPLRAAVAVWGGRAATPAAPVLAAGRRHVGLDDGSAHR
jgi:hypothetical protein